MFNILNAPPRSIFIPLSFVFLHPPGCNALLSPPFVAVLRPRNHSRHTWTSRPCDYIYIHLSVADRLPMSYTTSPTKKRKTKTTHLYCSSSNSLQSTHMLTLFFTTGLLTHSKRASFARDGPHAFASCSEWQRQKDRKEKNRHFSGFRPYFFGNYACITVHEPFLSRYCTPALANRVPNLPAFSRPPELPS